MTPVQLALTLLFLPLVSAAITAFFFRRNPLVGKILSIGTARKVCEHLIYPATPQDR